jgi:hypothetical protein
MTREEILQLATDVAANLGEGWTVHPEWDSNGRMIVHTDGRKLHIYAPGGYTTRALQGRVIVSGSYPYLPGRYTDPGNHIEITVRADRGAAVIAREITRRVLPEYTERYARVVADNETHAATVRTVREAEAVFCAAIGKPAPDYSGLTDWQREQRDRDARTSISLHGLTTGYGSVELYGHTPADLRAKVELSSITAETALAIIELLRERGEFGKAVAA